MISVKLVHLIEARQNRPSGYWEACLAAGQIEGDEMHFQEADYADLIRRFRPTSKSMAKTAIVSLAQWVAAGLPVTPPETMAERSGWCAVCPGWDARAGRCMECGCYQVKHWLATERCPRNLW